MLAAKVAGITFVNLCYVPNGSEVGSDKYAYKLAWLDALGGDWVAQLAAGGEPLMVVGDFNIAPEFIVMYTIRRPGAARSCAVNPSARACKDCWHSASATCSVSSSRRRAAFPGGTIAVAVFGATKACASIHLANAALAARCEACAIDLTPRRWDKPSDHAPVVARLRA